jgi:hypothetical protein
MTWILWTVYNKKSPAASGAFLWAVWPPPKTVRLGKLYQVVVFLTLFHYQILVVQ